jgi:hypothetical protein
MHESLERLARNQSVFREVNERIEEFAGDSGGEWFICECSRPDCSSTLELTVPEYEHVRSDSTWFFVKRGHDIPEIERVVAQGSGYVIVEKLLARDYAEQKDNRSDNGEGRGSAARA